jgi:branched-subunit amino acid transport protein
MSAPWAVVLVTGAGTVALKGLGPVLLGGRPLPPRLLGVVTLLAPALLAALVVTQAFGSGKAIVLDARAAGLAAAALALALRAPVLVVVTAAAAIAAAVRAFGWLA